MSVLLTLRLAKGAPLTNAEVDGNFTALNDGKLDTTGGIITGALQGTTAQFSGAVSSGATPSVGSHLTPKTYVDTVVADRLGTGGGKVSVDGTTGALSSIASGQFTSMTVSSTGSTPRYTSANSTAVKTYSTGTTATGAFTIRDETAGVDRLSLSSSGVLTIPGQVVYGTDPTGTEVVRLGVDLRTSGYISARDNALDADVRVSSASGGSLDWRVTGVLRWSLQTGGSATTFTIRDNVNSRSHVTYTAGSTTLTALTAFASQVTIGTDPTGANSLLRVGGGARIASLGVGTDASGTTGEIRATNEVTAYYSSDERLKENIVPIEDAIALVKGMRGVRFDWKDSVIEERGGEDGYFVRKQDVGVIAQEVQAVVPEVVAQRPDTEYLAVRYEKLVPVLLQAIKELTARVEQLERDNEAAW